MNAKRTEIARLLRAGLDAYGDDDSGGALNAWNAVLALDPQNADATDYIESLDGGGSEVDPEPVIPGESTEQTLFEETIDLVAQGRVHEAYALLEYGTAGAALDLDTLAVFDLVRATLLPLYRAGFGATARPRSTVAASQIAALELSDASRGLVAACDGLNTVDALGPACGLDDFEALHQLRGLVDMGIVSMPS